jgi:hypothetical protein
VVEQGRDEVLLDEGRLADAPDAGEKHPGEQALVQRAWQQELLRQRPGVCGAMKDNFLGHGDLDIFGVKAKF